MEESASDNLANKQISRIGLGCVTFGREIDKDASFEIMDCALKNGITLFDTAAVYGAGASESLIGEWLASRRSDSDRIILATKILPQTDAGSIERSVDESLKRLGVDIIDILYLHRWDSSFETDASLQALDQLIQKGKVKHLGVSNITAAQLMRMLRKQDAGGLECIRFVQNNHNLAVSEVDNSLRQICESKDVLLVTYSPLGAGFLTGKYQHGIQEGSRFAVVPGHQNIYFNAMARSRLVKLLDVAGRTGYTPSHLALAWAFNQPGVSSVLVGARTIKHLEQAFSALTFNDPSIFAELESI